MEALLITPPFHLHFDLPIAVLESVSIMLNHLYPHLLSKTLTLVGVCRSGFVCACRFAVTGQRGQTLCLQPLSSQGGVYLHRWDGKRGEREWHHPLQPWFELLWIMGKESRWRNAALEARCRALLTRFVTSSPMLSFF